MKLNHENKTRLQIRFPLKRLKYWTKTFTDKTLL